jgi:hypothetical protein
MRVLIDASLLPRRGSPRHRLWQRGCLRMHSTATSSAKERFVPTQLYLPLWNRGPFRHASALAHAVRKVFELERTHGVDVRVCELGCL